jgi:molybdopterin-binding protein
MDMDLDQFATVHRKSVCKGRDDEFPACSLLPYPAILCIGMLLPAVSCLDRSLLMLSARNQFPATVKSVKLGNVMAEVVMTMGGMEIVSAITRGSAEALDLKPGDSVKAVIKATEVLIDKG